VTRAGTLRAAEVAALWRGNQRVDLPAVSEAEASEWAERVADALGVLGDDVNVSDTGNEPAPLRNLATLLSGAKC